MMLHVNTHTACRSATRTPHRSIRRSDVPMTRTCVSLEHSVVSECEAERRVVGSQTEVLPFLLPTHDSMFCIEYNMLDCNKIMFSTSPESEKHVLVHTTSIN